MTERTFPTVDEVKATLAAALETIEGLTFHPHGYTIQDYPIGRRDRGLCKLEAEGAKGKGWRTVRTTTNARGRWCAPKKSTYFGGLCCVVTGDAVEREAAWLKISESSIGLASANGEYTSLAKAPHYCQPSRESRTYGMRCTTSRLTAAGLEQIGESTVEHTTIDADPAELCDAYDVWLAGRKHICGVVAQRMKAALDAASQQPEKVSAA